MLIPYGKTCGQCVSGTVISYPAPLARATRIRVALRALDSVPHQLTRALSEWTLGLGTRHPAHTFDPLAVIGLPRRKPLMAAVPAAYSDSDPCVWSAIALRAGKPMLTVPFGSNQPDNAWRLKLMGVARAISHPAYSAAAVASELMHLMCDGRYRT